MQIHLSVAVLVIGLSAWLKLSPIEWMVVVLCIGLVIALECVNTAIERMCDRVTKEEDPSIRQAKDVAAGAVLAMAITSMVVGSQVFIPRLIELWK